MKFLFFVKAALFFLLVSSVMWGTTDYNKKNDFQVWESQSFSFDLSRCTSAYIQTEFRWGDDASLLYLTYIQSGVRFSICDWLVVAPAYRHLRVLRPSDRKWVPIYDPLLDVTLKFKLGDWRLIDRSRTQYLIFESFQDIWQYRHRIKLLFPSRFVAGRFTPYVLNEFFFTELQGFSQNRLQFGGEFSLANGALGELFYDLRHIKFPDWRANHILGIYFFFSY